MNEGDRPVMLPAPPTGGLGMIWAQDVTGVLGARGGMLWRVPADFQHFRAMTMGWGAPCAEGAMWCSPATVSGGHPEHCPPFA